jgi:hypothetical protein
LKRRNKLFGECVTFNVENIIAIYLADMNLTIERNGGGGSWTKRRQKKRQAEGEK